MLFFLVACHATTTRCDVSETDIADDEVVDELAASPGELFAVVAARYTLPAIVGEGTTELEYVGERTGAQAVWVERTEVVTERAFGINGDGYVTTCFSTLRLPVEVSVTTANGAVDLSGELDADAHLYTRDLGIHATSRPDAGGTLTPAHDYSGVIDLEFDTTTLTRVFSCGMPDPQFVAPPGTLPCK